MRLLRGRWISDIEPSASVVVNESVARRDFPVQDPIGRRIRLDGPDSPFVTIVGVVADLKYAALDQSPEPEVYVPYSRGVPWGFTAVIRTSIESCRACACYHQVSFGCRPGACPCSTFRRSSRTWPIRSPRVG